jgi:hypothetical protein
MVDVDTYHVLNVAVDVLLHTGCSTKHKTATQREIRVDMAIILMDATEDKK